MRVEQQDAKESSSVTRGQNVLYVMPHDWASIAYFLGPMLERVDTDAAEAQILVVTADGDTAADIAAAVVRAADERPITPLAATSLARASRLLRLRPAHVVAGTPNELLQLVKSTTLKLGSIRAVAFAWADEILAAGGETQLETLMIEVPKEAARVIVTAEASAAVEAVVERYARRPRRVMATTPPEGDIGLAVEYVSVSRGSRAPVLRRVLDVLDPASATIFTRNTDSDADARETVRALGYGGHEAIRVARSGGGEADLVVLYDLPASHEELREAVGAQPKRVVALVQPRQLAGLRALAGEAIKPLALPEAAVRARSRETALRDDVRDILANEAYARELLTLEPLLDEHDGIEVAAAVLVLLERARALLATATSGAAAAPARGGASGGRAGGSGQSGGTARLFVNAGARDNVRPGDLMGAIVNETGTSRDAVGRIDVRDNFSLVEVPAASAEAVAEKLTGTSIRGRRVLARVDQERPRERPAGDRPPRERPPRERSGGDRPGRDRPGRDRPGSERQDRGARRERPDSARRGDRTERPHAGARKRPGGPPDRDRGPRPPRRDRE